MGAPTPDLQITGGNPTDDELAAVVAVLGAVLAARRAAVPPPVPRRRARYGRVTCTAARRRQLAHRGE